MLKKTENFARQFERRDDPGDEVEKKNETYIIAIEPEALKQIIWSSSALKASSALFRPALFSTEPLHTLSEPIKDQV